jgi:hypothetical protein
MKSHSRLTYSAVLACLMLAGFSTHLAAQGNLVFNGGFELDTNGWTELNMTGPGWSSGKGNPGAWVELDEYNPALATDPTISQLINGLVAGETYLVSGDYKKTINRNGVTNGYSFGVALDGVNYFQTADPGNFLWNSFSFYFTATSSSMLLSLASQMNGTAVSYGIDNIAMFVVPEPATWAMASLGLLLLAAGNNFPGIRRRVFTCRFKVEFPFRPPRRQ